ncbi:MAG: hydantoinase B/oxoprolinase family protein [Thalassobaculum sp.]
MMRRHGLYHAETGETLVQGKSGLPIFVGAMAFAVKAVIDKAARDRAAWKRATSGSSTIPMTAARICRTSGWCSRFSANGKVFCYLASVGHWHDVGGNVPGNYNPAATEMLSGRDADPAGEAVSMRGEFRQDVVDILQANSRLPSQPLRRSERPDQRAANWARDA